MVYGSPGAHWFHHELIPDGSATPPPGFLDQRSVMAVWQLANCLLCLLLYVEVRQLTRFVSTGYLLLGMLEGLGLRAVLKALPDNPVAQERLVGATLLAMAIADVGAR